MFGGNDVFFYVKMRNCGISVHLLCYLSNYETAVVQDVGEAQHFYILQLFFSHVINKLKTSSVSLSVNRLMG